MFKTFSLLFCIRMERVPHASRTCSVCASNAFRMRVEQPAYLQQFNSLITVVLSSYF